MTAVDQHGELWIVDSKRPPLLDQKDSPIEHPVQTGLVTQYLKRKAAVNHTVIGDSDVFVSNNADSEDHTSGRLALFTSLDAPAFTLDTHGYNISSMASVNVDDDKERHLLLTLNRNGLDRSSFKSD